MLNQRVGITYLNKGSRYLYNDLEVHKTPLRRVEVVLLRTLIVDGTSTWGNSQQS
jgi:hypothetical protein